MFSRREFLRGSKMKIKLNVTKDMKRALKKQAEAKDIERNEYIYQAIAAYVEEHAKLWEGEIDKILETAKLDGVDLSEKAKSAMKKTVKKMQPIILNVDEKTYYALGIIASDQELTKEALVVSFLK